MANDDGIASASPIWDALDAATRTRTAFTLGYLGTADVDGQPHVRAVIVRAVDAETGTVFFSTHSLSAKIGQLERNPLVAVTFYDAEADVQLRLEGRAEVVTDESTRRATWASFGAGTRQLFASPLRPGSPLPRADARADGGSSANASGDARDDAAGYARFAWVAVHVNDIDAIDLSADEHLRCRFTRVDGGWDTTRIVP
ncbi:hypothetical protein C5B85_14210 [Pseudoclavibacter sp. AY1F1]|uniref:pyridoxamine 5'-phosphate oxidase family protein n=1 Tax=Pseudoclavibacter sp. AY1F1 TaxID=2080583 RepID=UPI000CE765F3|nr:pyridoxamine 5'-phosphate oxidase family protein [Pseudoclavibacter sp. AY1F1]PPF43107.1 hypothetical protein C5B85_14210 [Pseudoclavibacter sp. AY1F1]